MINKYIYRILIWIVLVSCSVNSNPTDPNRLLNETSSLGLGDRIDSLYTWVLSCHIEEFDFNSSVLSFTSFENAKSLTLDQDNDKLKLLEFIPFAKTFKSINLVGYFRSEDDFSLVFNCWDDNALNPIGYLLVVEPNSEVKSIKIYQSSLDPLAEIQVLEFSLIDKVNREIISFTHAYLSRVLYDNSNEIQQVIKDLSEDKRNLYKGDSFEVSAFNEEGRIGSYSDTVWIRDDSIETTACFPENYLDYIYMSARNWYDNYSGIRPNEWNFKPAVCDK